MSQERKEQVATFTVHGEDPRQAEAPVFSNFVAVSHVGSEVQFEFIFLDLNVVAKHIEGLEKSRTEGAAADTTEQSTIIQGKTVAKIVVPVASFVQLKDHLNMLFEKLEPKNSKEKGYGHAGGGD